MELNPPFLMVVAIVVAVVVVVLSTATGRGRGGDLRRTCRMCGAAHPAFARFCRRCGSKL